MNKLEEIVASKYPEVMARKAERPVAILEKTAGFDRTPLSLKNALLSGSNNAIIAEFKRKSPSKGIFNEKLTPAEVTAGYVAAGAAGLSVLTDYTYFGGTEQDLIDARVANPHTPILRKDFMVDEYQIVEARAMGADVILLIAAGIDAPLLNRLAKFAKSLELEVLLEIHEPEELRDTLTEYVDMVGINNRNLKDFSVDIERSKRVAQLIPDSYVKISESGISNTEVVKDLKKYGFKGFLMGEAFMQTADPVLAIHRFADGL